MLLVACGPQKDAENVKVGGVDGGAIADAGPASEPKRTCAGEMQRCMRGDCTGVRERCAGTFELVSGGRQCDPQCEEAANCRVRCDREGAAADCVPGCTEGLDREARACVAHCTLDDECVKSCFKTPQCSSVICAFR